MAPCNVFLRCFRMINSSLELYFNVQNSCLYCGNTVVVLTVLVSLETRMTFYSIVLAAQSSGAGPWMTVLVDYSRTNLE